MTDILYNRLNQEGPSPTTSANLSDNRYTINILSVTGQSVVHISQPGYLLSIEVSSKALNSQGENLNISSDNSSTTLPELLTGKGEKVNNASDVAVNSDGSVQLTRSASQTLPPNNLRQNNSGTAGAPHFGKYIRRGEA
jgi:hypothetical protein